jgi:hypothetical protein
MWAACSYLRRSSVETSGPPTSSLLSCFHSSVVGSTTIGARLPAPGPVCSAKEKNRRAFCAIIGVKLGALREKCFKMYKKQLFFTHYNKRSNIFVAVIRRKRLRSLEGKSRKRRASDGSEHIMKRKYETDIPSQRPLDPITKSTSRQTIEWTIYAPFPISKHLLFLQQQ